MQSRRPTSMLSSLKTRWIMWGWLLGLMLGACATEEDLQLSQHQQPLQSTTSSSASFALFAYRNVWVEPQSHIQGDVGVRDQRPTPWSRYLSEITLLHHTRVVGNVLGDSIRIKNRVEIQGQVHGNDFQIDKQATLSQPPLSPLALPLPDITPVWPTVSPGSKRIIVPSRATVSLAAGSYRTVWVRQGSSNKPSILRLEGGTYHLGDLYLAPHSQVECAASCEVRIKGHLVTQSHTAIGPMPDSPLTAHEVVIWVMGVNHDTDTAQDLSAIAIIGPHSAFIGQLYVPQGILWVKGHSSISGTLISRWMVIGQGVTVAVPSPVLPPAGDGGSWVDASIGVDQGKVMDSSLLLDGPPDGGVILDHPALADDGLLDDSFRDALLDQTILPDSASGTWIGPEGGTVVSADGAAELEIPAGALSNAVEFRITPTSSDIPEGAIGTAYAITPSSVTFAQAATLRLTYDPAALENLSESALALAQVDHQAWSILRLSKADLTQHRVMGAITNTGTVGIVPSVCGDGVVSAYELCDGSDFNGQTCQALGFDGGTLLCTVDCTWDTSACTTCLPTSCSAEGKNCGTISDGCGGVLNCGVCAPPDTCGGSGVANGCGCSPSTCAGLGLNCGTLSDGCYGTLDCGTCTLPQTCGGSGVANICGCTPTTCAAELKECGTISDGCGGSLDCGDCLLPQTCGGSGVANICGCTPTTCAAELKECGTISDGCGGTLECGNCSPPDTCGGGGLINVCGCTPTTCAAEGKNCGMISDGCGSTLDCGTCPSGQICGWGGSPNTCGTIPPDPSTVAPPIDQTVATSVHTANAFLYTGEHPIQTGVTAEAIEAIRAGVIRGQVLDEQKQPLPEVTIRILGHPELGQTSSRRDGWFDMVVNGGGLLVVTYEKPDYLAIQRQVRINWQDYAVLDPVIMIQPDPLVNTISSFASTMQVAQGSWVTDQDGSRRATLLFPVGSGAVMTLPDGTEQPLDTLHVRATEYTVGTNGPARMPGDLPPNVAYTYAVEFSADEAIATQATQIEFTNPLVSYTENFLNMPIGQAVPVGYYDRQQGVWIPEPNGRVIKLLSITNGLADLDLNGTEIAATPAELEALGITAEEQAQLAALYVPGQSLWRVLIKHFSGYDFNWPWMPPEDEMPSLPPDPDVPGQPEDVPDVDCGSIIECQNQSLGETVPILGTPFNLYYHSRRMEARNGIKIYLSGATVPARIQRIDLEIRIAGQLHQQSFPAVPFQSTVFYWDKKDAHGRPMQGQQEMDIKIGYVYGSTSYNSIDTGIFGGPGKPFTTVTSMMAQREVRAGTPGYASPNRNIERTMWMHQTARIGGIDPINESLGGWTMDVVHLFDPKGRVLYLGDGGQRRGDGVLNSTIHPYNWLYDFYPAGMTVDEKGYIYLVRSGPFNNLVQRLSADGTSSTAIVGGLGVGFEGDGGPTATAKLNRPNDVALDRQGNIYIADTGNQRIRKIDPQGIITTFAGNGSYSDSGDGGPATEASFRDPSSVAVDGQGNVYISDGGNHRIRKVSPDGTIFTIAGTGVYGYGGDGGPAIDAQFRGPAGIAVDDLGNLYIADMNNHRIRKVGPDGIISTVAGTGIMSYSGDGGPAINATINSPFDLSLDTNGNLFITDTSNHCIRKVSPDGIITSIAGPGVISHPDGVPATKADVTPSAITVDHLGAVYYAHYRDYNTYKINSVLPGYSADAFSFASSDGSQVYRFNEEGRHLSTVSTLTGATLYRFSYDLKGRLVQITDGDGKVTRIERNDQGEPTAIVAPFGQVTRLATDSQGYLAQVTNPAAESTRLSYTDDGLLTSLTDPRGNTYTFTYDALKRLMQDRNPVGGEINLARTDHSNDHYTITKTTSEGRVTQYEVEHLPADNQHRINTLPSGLTQDSHYLNDATSRFVDADGTISTEEQGPDPRWKMEAPLSTSTTRTLPSGLKQTQTMSRTVSLSNSTDPLSLTKQTDTLILNGRTYTSVYDGPSRQYTLTSPEGRTSMTQIDAQERVVRQEMTGLAPVFYTYNALGQLTTIVEGTGAEARTTQLNYDAQGNLASITDPLQRSMTFEYDLANRVLRQILPGQRAIGFGYDPNGNLTQLTPPDRPAHGFEYTPVNLASTYTPPDMGTGTTQTQYGYNNDRQLTNITRPDGQTINVGYDAAGRLSSVNMPRGSVNYTYNPTDGNVASISSPDGITLNYTFDGSLLKSTTWSGPIQGSVSRTYNTDFNITSLSVNGTTAASMTYDRDMLLTSVNTLTISRNPTSGLITGTTLGNISTGQTYSSFGELESTTASFETGEFYTTRYIRDALGRITQKDETIEGVSSTTIYAYDEAGRLREVRENGTVVAAYFYDQNGNRLSATSELGIILTGEYDAQDRLTRYANMIYSYTANGELESKTNGIETTLYQYDVMGNLTAVTLPDTTQIEYLIDGPNRRVGKKINGTLVQGFLYKDSLKPIAELDGTNQVVSTFIYATKSNVPDTMVKGGKTYRIISDHLGSPRLVVDVDTGAIAQRIDYDEFGRVLYDTNPGFQPFGFAGGIYDQHTKLVRFGARDYDAEVGRWTAKDPIDFKGGDANLYGYVLNDPINFIDLKGKNAIALGAGIGSLGGPLGAAIGAAVGALLTGYLLKDIYDRLHRDNDWPKEDEDTKPKAPDEPDEFCKRMAVICRERCMASTSSGRCDQSMPFYRCVNKCLVSFGCTPGMY